jgi:hypothetical protein
MSDVLALKNTIVDLQTRMDSITADLAALNGTFQNAIVDLLSCLKDREGLTLNPDHVEIVHRAEMLLQSDPPELCVSGFAAVGGHCSDRECVCNMPDGFKTEVNDEDIDLGCVVRWIADGKAFSGNVMAIFGDNGDYEIEVEPIDDAALAAGMDVPDIMLRRSEIVGVQPLRKKGGAIC